MTPVRQTMFVADHPEGRGNCQSAAMASILDLPLDEVIDTASDAVRDGGFWPPIYKWLKSRGLRVVECLPGDARLIGRYSLAYGPSPRGPFYHAVVCKNGVMVWDPHPSDDGVEDIERHHLLMPIEGEEGE